MSKLPAIIATLLCLSAPAAYAVQTAFVEHSSEQAFKEGEPNQVLISSTGEISLAYQTERLMQDTEGLWLVNAILKAPNGDVYLGASGQGGIYHLQEGQEPQRIYGEDPNDARHVFSLALDAHGRLLAGTGGEQGKLLRLDPNGQVSVLYESEDVQYVWSIVVGPAGRIYLATGAKGQVVTLDADGQNGRVVYKATEKNILSLALDEQGILYAGADEKGLIYRIDPGTDQARIVYDSTHSEISGLVFDEAGNLYASTADADAAKPGAKLILSDGETSRPETDETSADEPNETGEAAAEEPADQPEKPADETAAPPEQESPEQADQDSTDADAADEQKQEEGDNGDEEPASPDDALSQGETGQEPASAGRCAGESAAPAAASEKSDSAGESAVGDEAGDSTPQGAPGEPARSVRPARQFRPAATQVGGQGVVNPAGPPKGGPGPGKPGGSGQPNEVYKITPQGYVTSIFNKPVIILALAYGGNGQLLLATGNDGQLLRLDVERQEGVVLHDDSQSAQVTALCTGPDGVILAGLANPGGVLVISDRYAAQGFYESPVIDAKQITRWGKIALAADVAAQTSLDMSTRSGNTQEPKSGPWQEWTPWLAATDEATIRSATGRFLQYRLRLASTNSEVTPTVTEVKIAYMIPNLAPEIANVKVAAPQPSPPNKRNQATSPQVKTLAVTWQAADANNDKLTFSVFCRLERGGPWIKLAEDLDKPLWAWDTLTVADGRYELRILASDEPSNPLADAQSATRVSAAVVVDNTAPQVDEVACRVEGRTVHVSGRLNDELSVIQTVAYCLDSDEEWRNVSAADGIYDSRSEAFAFDVTADASGQHLLALRFDDASGNTVYRNFIIEVQ